MVKMKKSYILPFVAFYPEFSKKIQDNEEPFEKTGHHVIMKRLLGTLPVTKASTKKLVIYRT